MSREGEILQALAILDLDQRAINLEAIKDNVFNLTGQELPRSWEVTARQVLRTLTELGQLEVGSSQSIQMTPAFRDSPRYQTLLGERRNRLLQDVRQRNIEGIRERQPPDGNGPGGPDNNSGDDGGRGNGFREVLAHRYLFSIPDEDFDEILNAI